MKKVKFIYNPLSGNRKIVGELDTIIELYQEKGLLLQPFRVSNGVKLKDAFIGLDDGSWDHILLAGGDGTISNCINLIKQKNIDLPVGIIPTGTANDFGKCIGLTGTIEEVVTQILNSKAKEVDLGYVNGKYFINILSFGLFTDVSQTTPTNLKNTMGKAAYYINGIKELPKFKKLEVSLEYDGKKEAIDSYLVFVFNGKTAGNIKLAYKAEIDDGLLDVIVVKANLKYTFKSIVTFLNKSHLEEKDNGILHYKVKKIKIDCNEEMRTDIDGEKGPSFPLEISCKGKTLKILGYLK